ncbi:hypothetical protein LXA43DRAFT_894496 [Ganoderma leucocontextum]|nr:hypothetical protein LXA43DRAFT_894496 [Ganoderma leucocontextum]
MGATPTVRCIGCSVRLYRGVGLRCDDCDDQGLYCVPCCMEAHLRHPLHRIQRWSGDNFVVVPLRKLGLRVQLGHPTGVRCTNAIPSIDELFVVLDLTGVHTISVDFCGCEGAVPFDVQVVRQRWFPATTVEPRTAATFRLLEHVHALRVSDRLPVSLSDYYQCLVRLTDNSGINVPPDRLPAFVAMVNEWMRVKTLKRAGVGHEGSDVAATPLSGCAIDCPACPQPGKNMSDYEERDNERYAVLLYDAIDYALTDMF